MGLLTIIQCPYCEEQLSFYGNAESVQCGKCKEWTGRRLKPIHKTVEANQLDKLYEEFVGWLAPSRANSVDQILMVREFIAFCKRKLNDG